MRDIDTVCVVYKAYVISQGYQYASSAGRLPSTKEDFGVNAHNTAQSWTQSDEVFEYKACSLHFGSYY